MQQIDLNQPMTVSLPLGAWNTVQMILAERPWREVNALIQALQQQLDTPQRAGNVVPWESREPAQ